MNEPYVIIEPRAAVVPIIVSVPHCGVDFPAEVRDDYIPEKRDQPDDTDWYVHDLYDFVSELGITMIHARYSRWVIDLNRDPESLPLYDDGRIITGLTSTTDFFGEKIYKERKDPNHEEVDRRLEQYYWPYYQKVQELLDARKQQFGKVLLWDAHSIRRLVPTIREEPFPDLILGDNENATADPKLIQTALDSLSQGACEVSHNYPFKGGHITRYFGRPDEHQHALQLEMNKILYMNDEELQYDPRRADQMRDILRPTLEALISTIKEL